MQIRKKITLLLSKIRNVSKFRKVLLYQPFWIQISYSPEFGRNDQPQTGFIDLKHSKEISLSDYCRRKGIWGCLPFKDSWSDYFQHFTVGRSYKWCHKEVLQSLYFIVLLKRARVPIEAIIMFYRTCIKPAVKYCKPVFYHSLSNYLGESLEGVQKRVMSILSPGESY